MEYSQKTADLIERMCRNLERLDFTLNKEAAGECLLKTYDLFGLKRPKKIVWCTDILDSKFQKILKEARSAESAWSAGSAGSALDYDFDWYVFEFEYCENPDELPNENDRKYLEYCELLMQAKEYGMGYRVEYENILYCVPTPLVLIDEQNKFHSTKKPSIRWRGGWEGYFLHGISFEKSLWKKIVSNKMSFKDVMAIENVEQRTMALSLYDREKLLKDSRAKCIHMGKEKTTVINGKQVDWTNYLYLIEGMFENFPKAYFLKYACPSTGRVYVNGVKPKIAEKHMNADACMAASWSLTPKQYNSLKIET